MKFNWGTGIALTYIIFAGSMIFAVFRSTQRDNSLVSDHYYADDLNYQQRYNKIANSQRLKQDLRIASNSKLGQVALDFPKDLGNVGGKIQFFCPSDSHQDFSIAVQANINNQQIISSSKLKKGLWEVRVDWNAGGQAYFKMERVIL
jgi:nitrogen fixation protein FixH